MRTLMFSAKRYDRASFDACNGAHRHEIEYLDVRLDQRTADLAAGYEAVCIFVNDDATAATSAQDSAELGVRVIALRCAGYNNVDVEAAKRVGVAVVRVPAYSPEAVAEHTLALILASDRHIHHAHHRVREGDFALDGLLGRGLHGTTAAVVGTGRIGQHVARLLVAFGCSVLAHDPFVDGDPLTVLDQRKLVDLGVQPGVLDCYPCQGRGETHHEFLVYVGEHLGRELVGEIEVAEHVVPDSELARRGTAHGRMVRWKAVAVRDAP